jgi:Tol biopolymer transport system component
MVTRTVTKEGINTKPACYTYEGKERVAFVSNRVGYSNIYSKPMAAETEDEEVVVKGERSSDFESFHIFSSKIDVNDLGQLTFVTKSGASDVIYVYNVADKEILKKFQFENLVSLASPNWSPDAEKIVFSGISFAGLSDLYVVDVETGQLQCLTNDFYHDHDPSWSPDGKVIAFSSDRSFFGKDGFMNLFLYDLEKGAIQYITKGAHNDYAPAWSPDGHALAFGSDRDGAFNIWMLKDVSASDEEDLLALTESNGHPSNHNSVNGHSENGDPDEYPSAIALEDYLKKLKNLPTSRRAHSIRFGSMMTESCSLPSKIFRFKSASCPL